MTTNLIQITPASWVQITTLADFTVQNVSPAPIMMAVADASPTIDSGMIISPKNGLNSTMVTGTVWAKSIGGNALVATTE